MGTTSLLGADPILCGPPSMQGAKITIESWQSALGGLSFDVSGDLTTFRRYITRGSFVEVLLYSGGLFGRVAVGRVSAMRYTKTGCTLGISDALALLDSRPVSDGSKIALFYGYHPDNRSATTLTADYTVGDTTIHVASTTGFTRETGGTGCIQIGDFYLTYTGTTGTTFTGVPALSPGDHVFGTAVVNASSGDAVAEVALLSGHPLDIAMKVMESTGSAVTPMDTYPAGWGYAIPESYIDEDDIRNEKTCVVKLSSGTYTLNILVSTHQETPRAWFLGWLASLGIFPVMYQGALSFRGASAEDWASRPIAGFITDADIDQSVGISSDWWDPNKSVEYATNTVISGDTTVTGGVEDLQTLPGAYDNEIDLSGVLFDYADAGSVMTEVYNRIYLFSRRVGEVLSIPLAGLAGMAYVPGDRITLTTTLPHLRHDYRTGLNLWIFQVSPDPRANRVTLRAVHLGGEEVWPVYGTALGR
jgi:hypothetical protein